MNRAITPIGVSRSIMFPAIRNTTLPNQSPPLTSITYPFMCLLDMIARNRTP